jgi:hypothetical protein
MIKKNIFSSKLKLSKYQNINEELLEKLKLICKYIFYFIYKINYL